MCSLTKVCYCLSIGIAVCSNAENPRVLERNFSMIETSIPWNTDTQTYDVYLNTPYNITCTYTDAVFKTGYNDVSTKSL